MIIGFTGSREGMNVDQMEDVQFLLNTLPSLEVHHGGCWGADLQFHELAWNKRRHIHPGPKSSHIGEVVYPTKPYLHRNQDIVDTCDILIACPSTKHEVLRSGTWATIRYARKVGKLTIILRP